MNVFCKNYMDEDLLIVEKLPDQPLEPDELVGNRLNFGSMG